MKLAIIAIIAVTAGYIGRTIYKNWRKNHDDKRSET